MYPIFSAHLSIPHLIFIHYEKASSQAWNHPEMLDIKSKTYRKKKSMLPNHVIHAFLLFSCYSLDVSNKTTANLSKTRGAAVAAHFHWRDSGGVEIWAQRLPKQTKCLVNFAWKNPSDYFGYANLVNTCQYLSTCLVMHLEIQNDPRSSGLGAAITFGMGSCKKNA